MILSSACVWKRKLGKKSSTRYRSKRMPNSKPRWKRAANLKKIKSCKMNSKRNERRMNLLSTFECAKKIASAVFKR